MKTDKLRVLDKPLKQILAHKSESAPKKPEKLNRPGNPGDSLD